MRTSRLADGRRGPILGEWEFPSGCSLPRCGVTWFLTTKQAGSGLPICGRVTAGSSSSAATWSVARWNRRPGSSSFVPKSLVRAERP